MSEKKRVIVLEELAPEGIDLLRGEGLEVDVGVGWDEDELLRRIPGCHGLIVGPAHGVTADMLRAGGDLQVVGRTGLSVAEIESPRRPGAASSWSDTPQSNAISAAEQALALVLACARDLAGTHADLRAGRWEPDAWARSGVEVRGRTLGIVGPGHVAPLLSEAALSPGHEGADGRRRSRAPLRRSRLHPGGSARRRRSLGSSSVTAEFAHMKHGVRVISLAPAGVVDPAAWARSYRRRQGGGLGRRGVRRRSAAQRRSGRGTTACSSRPTSRSRPSMHDCARGS